jgi:hypothetical protein
MITSMLQRSLLPPLVSLIVHVRASVPQRHVAGAVCCSWFATQQLTTTLETTASALATVEKSERELRERCDALDTEVTSLRLVRTFASCASLNVLTRPLQLLRTPADVGHAVTLCLCMCSAAA